jgi:lipopolysaccharide/colanic/teichoic acid biosynthesis glycosyltransferase
MKRAFDLAVSAGLIVILLPLFLLVAIVITIGDGGPVLYGGVRAGRGRRPFRMLKFRTMVLNADRIGGPSTAADDPRVTRVGRILRDWKLDELPQLLNVFSGDMSLVGPRPEVESEVDTYTGEEAQLLSVRPGITDYASIRFRNEGEILRGAVDPHEAYRRLIRPEKVRLGLEYVRTRSLRTDLHIIWKTSRAVFKRRAQ